VFHRCNAVNGTAKKKYSMYCITLTQCKKKLYDILPLLDQCLYTVHCAVWIEGVNFLRRVVTKLLSKFCPLFSKSRIYLNRK
jgi:hypothetical protein